MQDAVAACREVPADAPRRAEGTVGDEQYICKLVDGQVADGVEVGLWCVDAALFIFRCVIIYSELNRTRTLPQNTIVVFTDWFIP